MEFTGIDISNMETDEYELSINVVDNVTFESASNSTKLFFTK